MTRRSDTWFPFHTADYLRDTQRLNTEQHGAYLLLLIEAWNCGGPVSATDAELAAVTRMTPAAWRRVKPTLQRYFIEDGGEWRSPRMDREIAKAKAISESRRQSGKRGGRPKQTKTEKKPNGLPEDNQTGNQNETHAGVALQSPSEIPSSVPNGTGADAPLDPDKKAWAEVVTLLASAGVSDKQARSFFGRLLKESGLQARDLLASIAQAQANSTGDPQSYLRKAADAVGRRKGTAQLSLPEGPDWPARVQVWRQTGRWIESLWGPEPGDPQCLCPAELLEGVG
ncbi:DUF1376 domain-containing protein [Brevundimonas sp. BAL450]|uniref:YdaU family protein n=1 Tax=Brevundimonas sp. BAL450 TaxID=1708162 RepID=UPI0018CA7814|nr:DUF1376 domain-containing protein [Brevundimonas sp. BAL450]MBG7616488.1 DUF1376 domain-containing protein [Brevundimonas sp. BAL450]